MGCREEWEGRKEGLEGGRTGWMEEVRYEGREEGRKGERVEGGREEVRKGERRT